MLPEQQDTSCNPVQGHVLVYMPWDMDMDMDMCCSGKQKHRHPNSFRRRVNN